MAKLILVGDTKQARVYVSEFINNYNIKPHRIRRFEDKFLVEHARFIGKVLSLIVDEQILFLIESLPTIAGQNALLKLLEETDENVHFIFMTSSYDDLLPTIRSRCVVRRFVLSEKIDPDLLQMVSGLNGNIDWESLDKLSEYVSESGIEKLIPVLRRLLLDCNNLEEIKRYYIYCKRLLPALTLVGQNNINSKIFIESVFAG